MSHYSDIGFEVKSIREVNKIINLILSSKLDVNNKMNKKIWKIQNGTSKTLQLSKIDNLKFFVKGDLENKKIDDFFVTQKNQNLSLIKVHKNSCKRNERNEFPVLNFYNQDDIPFWVTCFNAEIFCMNNEESCEIELISFANNIEEIKDAEDMNATENFNISLSNKNNIYNGMADESYIANFEKDISTSWLSGIIQDFALLENPITHNKYYSIDIICLKLNIKLLIDPKLIQNKELKKGKVICGEFWNTGVLVNPNEEE